MVYTTLISASELAQHLDDQDWAVIDCRYGLADPQKGRNDYLQAHIPGAVYAHLDENLSAQIIPGVTGRHPLPDIDRIAAEFSHWGIGPGVQVVAYDDTGGALPAARLWWLLRWLGHEAAAVLDGGWQAWQMEQLPVHSGEESRPGRTFTPEPQDDKVASSMDVDLVRLDERYRVLDARSADRFRGENETIDPVPGHIPGAISAPYQENLTPEGTFKPPEVLRQYYQKLLGDVSARNTIVYCGSGVTANHDILAMVHAGLEEPRLYAGSWSEWITDPKRPVDK